MKKNKGVLAKISALCLAMMLLLCLAASADEERTVRVGFFPMEGYHNVNPDGSFSGMDVEYINALNKYLDWNIRFVKCASWDDALRMLKEGRLDLVGSAQYNEARAKIYDYASLSSGYTYGTVAVNGNSPLAFEDFEAMKNISFGIVRTYVRRAEFLDYMKAHGIDNPKIYEYENTAELLSALDRGEVDAIVHTLMEIRDGQRVIGHFANAQFYYISYKDNDGLMDKLESAIAKLKRDQPNLENRLMNKYYNSRMSDEIVFTSAEKEYIKAKGVIKVGYPDGFYPFSLSYNGDFTGLTRVITDNFAKEAGCKILYTEFNNYPDARRALLDGEIDMIGYSTLDEDTEDEPHVTKAVDYVSVPLALIVKEEKENDKLKTVAASPGTKAAAEELVRESGGEVLVLDDESSCINAVLTNKANAAVCSGYISSSAKQSGMGVLKISRILRDEVSVGISVSSAAPKELSSMLEKAVSPLSEQEINEYMMQYSAQSGFNLYSFLEKHRFKLACIIILIILAILLVILHSLRDAQKIQKLMYLDSELNIWNINYLYYWTERRPGLAQNKYAIVCAKINQFRLYGTIYGWRESNKLLQAMVKVLNENIEPGREMFAHGKPDDDANEIYARSYGDRFALMLKYDTEEELINRLKKMLESFEIELRRTSGIGITVNLGVKFIEDDTLDIKSAAGMANQALEFLDMKDDNQSHVRVYDNELNERLREQHERDTMLEKADIHRDFVVFYQAKVDIRTQEVVGAETLIRYINPHISKGFISPFYFVPYFEKTGKIKELDFFAFEMACRFQRKRLDAGKKVVPISCNFSRIHFTELDFPERLLSVFDRYNIPRDLIEIEITETIIMDDLHRKQVYKIIDELHANGIKLDIDDFGSGYSSLGVFEKIPASVLKLDRAFFINKVDKERQTIIMRQIVQLADSLNAKVVCEGVETDEDVALMMEIGAYIAQGYKYARPEPEEEFVLKLKD